MVLSKNLHLQMTDKKQPNNLFLQVILMEN